MNRQFKFRVWDNQEKNWNAESEEGVYGWDTEGITLNQLIQYITAPRWDGRFIIQQFTGLTDENRKEIYEGDIITDEEGSKAVIVFENGTFCADFHRFDEEYDVVNIYGNLQEINLIGNIFENPELLK
jgi:hypothetical protein